MSYNIEDIIGKYVELRDRKAELAKKHDAEMQQFSVPMQTIENYLMHQMNELGVDQLKGKTGTAFRSVTASVQLKEPAVFKQFVFAPVINAITTYLAATGISIQGVDTQKIYDIIRDLARWDVVDFRAGKKGIQEYQEQTEEGVPGVSVNSIATINIRRP